MIEAINCQKCVKFEMKPPDARVELGNVNNVIAASPLTSLIIPSTDRELYAIHIRSTETLI